VVVTRVAAGLLAASIRRRSVPAGAATGSPLQVTKVDFIGIPSTDFDRSMAFYVDTLGLRRDEHSKTEFWVGAQCYGFWKPEWMNEEIQPSQTTLALHVEDVPAARAELEAKGVEFAGDFDSGVCHMAFFKDPDGNHLMLHKRYKAYEQ
jgi:predicted enzyme related to lactoylglutathione lyase